MNLLEYYILLFFNYLALVAVVFAHYATKARVVKVWYIKHFDKQHFLHL